ncbi:hypothetical protein [Nonomuraea sp. NPDC052265]|uniref:hypothetical protein n=1 Tax=Nonomuraea sp. NPDC052265 TaxID=3364374 RepID=UPI0037C9695B
MRDANPHPARHRGRVLKDPGCESDRVPRRRSWIGPPLDSARTRRTGPGPVLFGWRDARSGGGDDGLGLAAQAVDAELHPVARPQVDRWVETSPAGLIGA